MLVKHEPILKTSYLKKDITNSLQQIKWPVKYFQASSPRSKDGTVIASCQWVELTKHPEHTNREMVSIARELWIVKNVDKEASTRATSTTAIAFCIMLIPCQRRVHDNIQLFPVSTGWRCCGQTSDGTLLAEFVGVCKTKQPRVFVWRMSFQAFLKVPRINIAGQIVQCRACMLQSD